MAIITAISNQKGGVGKTTTAQALACGIRKRGQRVLLVDLDPQANLTYSMGATIEEGEPSVYECMIGEAEVTQVIRKNENGEILPSSLSLSGIERKLNSMGRAHVLRKLLEPIRSNYDHIIIDTPPALNVMTENAYTAADQVIVTLEASAYSVQGVFQLYGMIEEAQEYTNKGLKLAGVLICRYKGQTTIGKGIRDQIEQLAEQLGTTAYETVIREGVAVQEAQAVKANLQEYAPQSNQAKDYEAFVEEFLRR